MTEPLVDKEVILEKIPGKGGWTYAPLPEIPQEKHRPFGWRRVRGFIDSFEISRYHLMPMGNGQLFLPVKAQIRKQIKKQEGDMVRIVLYADDPPSFGQADFLLCIEDDPDALAFFKTLRSDEQKKYQDWVESATNEDLRIRRMAETVGKLARHEKLK